MNNKLLIKELVKDKNVGAIIETSNVIITKMINKINFEETNIIVEYGPGQGGITKQLLSRMTKDSTLFVFETNPNFIENLSKITDRRLIVINSDAENANEILTDKFAIQKVDYIVSTIPFTFLDKQKRKNIISKSYTLLCKKGKFITYQYSLLIRKMVKNIFDISSMTFSMSNIPPVFLIEGIKV